MNEPILSMELHEEIEIMNYKILKVIKGWIYYSWNSDKQNYNEYGVFVHI